MMRLTAFMPVKIALAIACAGLIVPQSAFAQEHGAHGSQSTGDAKPLHGKSTTGNHRDDGMHGGHGAASAPAAGNGHEHMPGMRHDAGSDMGHEHAPATPAEEGHAAEHGAAHGTPSGAKEGMAHGEESKSAMQGMTMGRMQGGKAPPDARDPDAYAEGIKRKSMPAMEMADDELFGSVIFNELEYRDSDRNGHGQSLDLEAWYGGDYNKVWFKADGERRNGHLENMRTEVLWDRVFATFWSTQIGIRHDTGGGPSRDWLALGVRGLAPYWFHIDAAVYAGGNGAIAGRAEARYDLLLTQRLVLQPRMEANLYSKNDASRGIGSGLSDAELGLRLRYEIYRQFAPYIGVVWKRLYGNTADYAREAGERDSDTEYVAGVRLWF